MKSRHEQPIPTRAFALIAALLLPLVAGCDPPPTIRVTAPVHGAFLGAGAQSIQVTGSVDHVEAADAVVTLNGVAVPVQADKTFSAVLPVASGQTFQPILAELTKQSNGAHARQRAVAILGDMIPEGQAIANAVTLRIRQAALDEITPAAAAVVESQLDLAALLPQDPIDIDGASIKVLLDDPVPTFEHLTLAADALSGRVDVTTVLESIFLKLKIDKPGILGGFHCTMELTIPELTILAHEQLDPSVPGGHHVAVQQIAVAGHEVMVSLVPPISNVDCSGSGLFENRKEKKIREAISGGLADALEGVLEDPDGVGGPNPAPIAAAIEDQLAGLDLESVVVPGLQSTIGASFTDVAGANGSVFAKLDLLTTAKPFGTAFSLLPGLAAPRALRQDPDLPGSLRVVGNFPTFGSATTPHGHQSYHAGLGISLSALNQLLMTETESRRFQTVVTTQANGEPITAGTLAGLITAFSSLPADAPLELAVKATLAPMLTGKPGPHGELAEVVIGQLVVTVRQRTQVNGQPVAIDWLSAALDARVGVNLGIGAGGALAPALGTVDAADLHVTVLGNAIHADESLIQTFGPFALANQLPTLAGAVGSLPLPHFLGLSLQAVEVTSASGYVSLFANLVTQP